MLDAKAEQLLKGANTDRLQNVSSGRVDILDTFSGLHCHFRVNDPGALIAIGTDDDSDTSYVVCRSQPSPTTLQILTLGHPRRAITSDQALATAVARFKARFKPEPYEAAPLPTPPKWFPIRTAWFRHKDSGRTFISLVATVIVDGWSLEQVSSMEENPYAAPMLGLDLLSLTTSAEEIDRKVHPPKLPSR
jgi:hypothetical protein